MRKFILLVLFLSAAITASAQRTVKGIVYDETGTPAGGIVVIVKETNATTTTDNSGKFEINADTGNSLEFSCIGMKTSILQVGDPNQTIKVHLQVDTQSLEELVIVGYGVTRKRDLAGSVSQIKAADVKAGVITSAADLLRGRAAGVTVRQESFEPGSGMTVRIRGASTIAADNTPLYVVDGIQSAMGNQLSP